MEGFMKKHSLIKGTIILGCAGVLARFLGLFFRWPIIMLIGDEGMGYYQMSYPLYMLFIGIATGIPVAISKMISERSAMNDKIGILQVLKSGVLVMIIIGGGVSLLFLLLSKQIMMIAGWDPKAYYSLLAIAIAPIFISIVSVYRGFFQGMQNMTPTAVSQLVEQVGRVLIGVGLAVLLLPRGIEYAAGGAALGAAAGGLFAGIYLWIKYRVYRKSFFSGRVQHNSNIVGELISIAIPISLGAVVGTIMNLIDSMLVPQKLLQAGFTSQEATIMYGQLTGKAFVLVNVPLTLSIALCAALVPIIAEAYILKRRVEVINKVEMAVKISTVIALPSMFGLFYMSGQVLNLLFPGHAEGYMILKYASLSIPFIILTQSSTAILQGTGHYISPIINLIFGCIIKIVITFMLVPIPYINIYGAIVGTLAAYIVTTILNLRTLSKSLNISINYYNTTIKPAYASVIMIFGVVLMFRYSYNYTLNSKVACLISIFVGIIIYGIMIVLSGVFKYQDIKRKFLRG
jgi:stage V sporulation protein B